MASQGPLYAGTVTGFVTGNGNTAADDGAYATGTCYFNYADRYFSNFGFSIPSDATIEGIEIEMEAKSNVNFVIVDEVKAINVGSTKIASAGGFGNLSTTDTVYMLGGPNDPLLVGDSWTAADINNSGFTIRLSDYKDNSGTATISVDYLRVTVYYVASEGVGGGSSATGNMLMMF